MPLDNSPLVRLFVPAEDDGDSFIYTELLDRSKGKGNNVNRLIKTFYHRSREEFDDQMPAIKELCDWGKVRAYTRLSTRSFEKVSKVFVQLVVDAALSGNHSSQRRMYSRALGTVTPVKKVWLLDVDAITETTKILAIQLREKGYLLAEIPSKKGCHLIVRPFDERPWLVGRGWADWGDISLHKDNPTNLYIPDGAA